MGNLLYAIFPNERFVDLNLYQYGWEQTDPGHMFGPNARNHYLFHYIISGTGTLMYSDSKGQNKTVLIRSGQGFLLSPKQVTTYWADQEHPWEYTWVEFDGTRASEALELAGLNEDAPVYKSSSRELSKQMADEMLYIVHHSDAGVLNQIGHLYLFMDLLAQSSVSRKLLVRNGMREFYIKEAMVYVEQNFQNDITVEDIAANCKLNRTYFSSIFKDSTGKTPQAFLIEYRMMKAQQLLRGTELSIADIGNAVGYPNQLNFSRTFKNHVGKSPREWRSDNKIVDKNK